MPRYKKQIIASWEGLHDEKFVRFKIRATPRINASLMDVGRQLVHLFSSNALDEKAGTDTFLLGEPTGNTIELAVPINMMPPHLGITQVLNVISVPTEYDYAERIIFEGIEFPRNALSEFVGPQLGLNGLARTFHADLPLLGVILKPRVMPEIEECISHLRAIGEVGVDFVVDDELTVDFPGISFEDRIPRMIETLEGPKSNTSARNGYVVNVTARPALSLSMATYAQEEGASGVVTNPLVVGFGALEDLAECDLGIPIFATNMGAAFLAKEPDVGRHAGLTESLLSKLSRMSGADAVHAGISGSDWYDSNPGIGVRSVLSSPLGEIKPACRVIAGGLDVIRLIENWPFNGEGIIFEAGASVFNHPGGPGAGLKALKIAREIAIGVADQDISDPISYAKALLVKRSEKFIELRMAIDQTGWKPDHELAEVLRTL